MPISKDYFSEPKFLNKAMDLFHEAVNESRPDGTGQAVTGKERARQC